MRCAGTNIHVHHSKSTRTFTYIRQHCTALHDTALYQKKKKQLMAADTPREDDLQIIVSGDGIELAHEQHILRRLHICVREISDHLQDHRVRPCRLFSQLTRKKTMKTKKRYVQVTGTGVTAPCELKG